MGGMRNQRRCTYLSDSYYCLHKLKDYVGLNKIYRTSKYNVCWNFNLSVYDDMLEVVISLHCDLAGKSPHPLMSYAWHGNNTLYFWQFHRLEIEKPHIRFQICQNARLFSLVISLSLRQNCCSLFYWTYFKFEIFVL